MPHHTRWSLRPVLVCLVLSGLFSTAAGQSCTTTSPQNGDTIKNFVLMGFTGSANDPANKLIYTMHYSTDHGVTWTLATDFGGGSVFGNPTLLPKLGGAETWEWDTSANTGFDRLQLLDFRITVSEIDPMSMVVGSSYCLYSDLIVNSRHSCDINSPLNGTNVSGNTLIDFDLVSPAPNGVDFLFEYSTDGGSSFSQATDAGGGNVTGNPVLGAPPGNYTWEWAVDTNLTGGEAAIFRITLNDAVFGYFSGTCEVDVNGPGVSITSPLWNDFVTGDAVITVAGGDPASAAITSTFEYSTDDGSTWFPATAASSSAVANPDPMRATPFSGVSFTWDTDADDVEGQDVLFRVTADNGSVSSETILPLQVASHIRFVDPVDSAFDVSVTTDLTLTYNDGDVQKGTGNIIIYRASDDMVLQTIDVTGSEVSIANNVVTIDPPGPLPLGNDVYVLVEAGAIENLDGDAYKGISDKTIWDFKTFGATTDVSLDGSNNLVIEDVGGGDTDDDLRLSVLAGDLIVYDPNNALGTAIAGSSGSGTNTLTIPLSSIGGSQIIVNTQGGDDILSLDFTVGDFGLKVVFDGGGQNTGDALKLLGAPPGVTDADFTHTGPGRGSITLGSQVIEFTGLE